MLGRNWLGVTIMVLALGFCGTTSGYDVTDTEWDINIKTTCYVADLGYSGGWFAEGTDYTIAFTADSFSITDADDTVVLSGSYEQNNWGRLNLEADEDELAALIGDEVAGLVDEGETFTQDSLELGNVWDSSSAYLFFNMATLSISTSARFDVTGTVSDDDEETDDVEVDASGYCYLYGRATLEVDAPTHAGSEWDLTTGSKLGAWNWTETDDGWESDTLIPLTRNEGSMDLVFGETDDVLEGEFLATLDDDSTLSGTFEESFWSIFSWSFGRFTVDVDETEWADHIAAAIDAALADSEEEISIVSVTVESAHYGTYVFGKRMRLFWGSWITVTADVGDDTGLEYSGFYKLGGWGMEAEEDSGDDDGFGLSG